MADVKLCDVCLLDGKVNPGVTYTWGFRGLRRLHLCTEHEKAQCETAEDQTAMLRQVEAVLRDSDVLFKQRAGKRTSNRPQIRVVPNEYGTCPGCGSYWGHPSSPETGAELNWPNRQKVDQMWRCYNPACNVRYFDPQTGEVEYEGTPEQQEETNRRAAEWADSLEVDTDEEVDGIRTVTFRQKDVASVRDVLGEVR